MPPYVRDHPRLAKAWKENAQELMANSMDIRDVFSIFNPKELDSTQRGRQRVYA